MKRTRPTLAAFRLAAALAAPSFTAPVYSPTQEGRAEIDAAKARILAAVDPFQTEGATDNSQERDPEAKAPPSRASSRDELSKAIAELMNGASANTDIILGLGSGAVPALRGLADAAPIRTLIEPDNGRNPLPYLARIDPNETVDYYTSLLSQDVERFTTLAFLSNGGPIYAAKKMTKKDRQRDATRQFFERACLDERLDVPFRIRLGMEALVLNISTPKIKELLLNSTAMWPTEISGSPRNVAALYVKANGVPAPDLAPNVAQFLWGYSYEVDEALTRHEDPNVRVTFARRMEAVRNPHRDPEVVKRVPLLVRRALEATPALRAEYFGAVAHVLRHVRSAPILPLDLLAELVQGSQTETLNVSALSYAIMSQLSEAVQPAASVTEAQWVDVIRAVAACENRDLRAEYLGSIYPQTRYGPALIAYARVMLESGALRSLNFRESIHNSDAMNSQEKARTNLRLMELFLGKPELLDPFCDEYGILGGLASEHLESAVRLYGDIGPAWNQKASEDATAWGTRDAETLRELCAGEDLGWGPKAVAAVGLLNGNRIADGALAARILIHGATTPDRIQTTHRLLSYRPKGADRSNAWAELVAHAMEAAGTRPDALAVLPDDVSIWSATPEQKRRIIKEASALSSQGGARAVLKSLAEHLVYWMPPEPELRDARLLLDLLRLGPAVSPRTSTLIAQLALSTPSIRDEAMATLLEKIREGAGTVGTRQATMFSVIKGATDKEMDALIQAVTDSADRNLLEDLENRLVSLSNIKAAQRSWQSASKGAPTKEAAIERILGMLASEDEDVRVEVILGLSTLGAVEALPTLIEIVGSGTAREKAAAKESLAFLRELAKREASRETPRRVSEGDQDSGN